MPDEKTVTPDHGEQGSRSSEFGKRLPNILSFFRLLIVPVFVVLLMNPTPEKNLWAAGLFIIASLTDWLDGYIARVYQAESILGTLLDPLADKILVMAALIMLAAASPVPRIPAWLVVLLLSRELLITGLRSLAAVKGVVVAASTWAKHKTAWTMVAIIFLLIDAPYVVFGFLVDFHWAGQIFLWIAVVLSLSTGAAYAIDLRKVFD